MTNGVNDIIDAIDSGDSMAIDAAFNKEMAIRVSDRLDSMRQDVAKTMFRSENTEDLSVEDKEDLEAAEEATQDEVVDLNTATDELDIEVQDTADAPVEPEEEMPETIDEVDQIETSAAQEQQED